MKQAQGITERKCIRMDRTNEQHSSVCYGSCKQGNDIHIIFWRKWTHNAAIRKTEGKVQIPYPSNFVLWKRLEIRIFSTLNFRKSVAIQKLNLNFTYFYAIIFYNMWNCYRVVECKAFVYTSLGLRRCVCGCLFFWRL